MIISPYNYCIYTTLDETVKLYEMNSQEEIIDLVNSIIEANEAGKDITIRFKAKETE